MCEHGDSPCKGLRGSSRADCTSGVTVCGAQRPHWEEVAVETTAAAVVALSRHRLRPSHMLYSLSLLWLCVLARTPARQYEYVVSFRSPKHVWQFILKETCQIFISLALNKTAALFTNLC